MNLPTNDQLARASERRDAFIAAIPPELAAAEDSLPRKIASLNASVKSKLGHIYRLVDEVSKVRAPFVACREGCASCCKMNVTISSLEAERISKATGLIQTSLTETKKHDATAFAGEPCPFLSDKEACSIYEYRPLVCRSHASFFDNASPCHPSVMLEVRAPEVRFSGPSEALVELARQSGSLVMADIRDFFPNKKR